VRNERNKAREESKQLRCSLELSIKEASKYKREKHELEKEIERIHMLLMKHASQFDKSAT
jgi:coiled-coil domain-containing protein 102